MDYEKMYKEALERAKKLHKGLEGYNSNRKVIENIFPELAESEDERIKKTIRQLLETARDAHSNTTLAKPFIDALAWLEKQKEQKNTSASTMAPSCWEVEQKEQKPVSISCGHENDAEWSEEDEKMRDRLITRLNWITYNTRTDGTSPNITFFDEIDWLKSLRPSWKPSDMNTNCQGCLYWTGKCKLPKGLDCPERKEEQK